MELSFGSTATGDIQSRAMPITCLIPSHDLVVVRLGHYRGESAGAAGFSKALALLIEAVPKAQNEAIHPPIEK